MSNNTKNTKEPGTFVAASFHKNEMGLHDINTKESVHVLQSCVRKRCLELVLYIQIVKISLSKSLDHDVITKFIL